MNANPNINMLEATRLTREGRLAEAMALLQGGLSCAHLSRPQRTITMKTQASAQRRHCRADHRYGAAIVRRRGMDPAEVHLPKPHAQRFQRSRRRLGPGTGAGGTARLPRPNGPTWPDAWSRRAGRTRCQPVHRPRCRRERASKSRPLPTRREAEPTSFTSQAATRVSLCRSW